MEAAKPIIEFEDVKTASESGAPKIIDVRNPDEFAAGRVPKSINIPLPEVAAAFAMDAALFKEKYGCDLPGKDEPLISTCRSGKRATTALEQLVTLGYNKVVVYSGSWLEWVAKGEKVEKAEEVTS